MAAQEANERDGDDNDYYKESMDGAKQGGINQHIDNIEDSSQRSDAPFEDGGNDGGDLDGGDGGDGGDGVDLGQERNWEDKLMDVEDQDNHIMDDARPLHHRIFQKWQEMNVHVPPLALSLLAKAHLDVVTAQDLLVDARLNIMATWDLVNMCHLQVSTPTLVLARNVHAGFFTCKVSTLLLTMQLLLVVHALIALHPLVLTTHKPSRQTKRTLPSLGFIHLVEHQDAMQLAQEVLNAELWVCHQKKLKFENGKFSLYCHFLTVISRLIARLLSRVQPTDVLAELKKVVISIAKLSYDIFPKGTTMRPEEIKNCIAAAATKLLKTGDYLQIPDSSNGKFKNFILQALKDVCLEFFYSNSKKALKNMDDFCQTIPVNGLILVAAVTKGVISGFSKMGTDKVPELSTDRCRTNFNKLRKSVDKLLNIPERREELEEMLEQWAKIGMGKFDWHVDGSAAGSDTGNINIVLMFPMCSYYLFIHNVLSAQHPVVCRWAMAQLSADYKNV
ncbi:hypothetical protein F4604DRAFT_1675814 [Suillus subluteus]|nr:hypothetical protein F4604DRAFT_1675814 [Suillus subluteus]